MTHSKKIVTCLLVSVALAGCSSNDDVVTGNYTSFAEIDADATAMQSKYTDANGDLLAGVVRASPSDIPASGTATYNGFVGGDVAGSDLVGELTVEADIGASTLTSTATGFFHETDGAYSGTLSGNGILTTTSPMGVPQVSTSLDGTLSNGGTDYTTAIALEGDLVSDGTDPAGAMAGVADGFVGSDFFTGVFVAEK